MNVTRRSKTLDGIAFKEIDIEALIGAGRPCILKGMVRETPLVLAGKKSDIDAMSHLQSFASEHPLLSYKAEKGANGRFFYTPDVDGLNFTTSYVSSTEFFETLRAEKLARSGIAHYVCSAEVARHFPELLECDGLQHVGDVFQKYVPRVGAWLGNRTIAATHFDVSNNIAACMVGKRRFTLFPPSQTKNLYPGPLEPTPGGQVVSMFDINDPDFERYPKAKEAMQHAEVAELDAGDVLIYPAMWWHQVEALSDFNVMINYWWNTVPAFFDDPMTTLLHGLLSLRDRPDNEKEAWRTLFDYYVFGDADAVRDHLPQHIWGALAPMNDAVARRLRAKIIKNMNR